MEDMLMQTDFIIKNKNPRIKSLGDNITSHHTMGAFFSSQDNLMLQQEGNDTNCFVSLVVDTRGQYVARITRKVQTKSEVTIKNLGTSYEFFGEGNKEITPKSVETTKVVDKEVIEYFDLDVERHTVDNSLEYLDTRFEEIAKKKEEAKSKIKANTAFTDNTIWQSYQNPKEPNLFDYISSKVEKESSLTKEDEKTLDAFMNIDWKPNPKKIHKAVVTIITCSFITNPDKFELKQWINKYMVKVYKGIFGEQSINEDPMRGGAFTEWKDFIIQHILDYFDVGDIPGNIDDWDALYSIIAQALSDEIYEYLGSNPYIDAYYNSLIEYCIK